MIYDISQEVLSCKVFPGDPAPKAERLLSMEDGAVCNLTAISMCAHNGTHVDAPFHFVNEGRTIEQIDLDVFVGRCYVARLEGDVTAEDAARILEKARTSGAEKRILIAGKAVLTEAAAQCLAQGGVKLYGNESQTVGPEDSPAQVHRILLGADMALLEGAVLANVPEGTYLLFAAPISLAGCEGAPCRAVLCDLEGML